MCKAGVAEQQQQQPPLDNHPGGEAGVEEGADAAGLLEMDGGAEPAGPAESCGMQEG